MLRGIPLGVFALATTATVAAAQMDSVPLDSVPLGSRIRVETTANEWLQGFVRSRTESHVRIHADFDLALGRTPDTTWTIARTQMRNVWLQTGTKWKSGAKLGARIGVGVGALAGCLVGLIPEDGACELLAPVGAGVLGLAGGITGAAIGAHIRVWTPLRL